MSIGGVGMINFKVYTDEVRKDKKNLFQTL